ncbi:hypothetical protein [Methylomagnum sp.]
MSSYTIRPIGFSDKEAASLEAIFTIASGRLRDNWRWAAAGTAHIYLAAVESPQEWEHYRQDFPGDRLLACVPPDLGIDAHWRIQRDPARLPSIQQLIQTLDAAGTELASGSPLSPRASEPISPPEATDDNYDPARYLIGIVRECLADGLPRRLAGQESGPLLIDPRSRLYFAPGDQTLWLPLLSTPRDRIQTQPLDERQMAAEAAAMESGGLGLDDLIFLAALRSSQGRLWTGCRLDEPVRLKRWPNLKSMSEYVDYIGLMAFMSNNRADLSAVAARTGNPLDKVIDFHNACMALDLLQRGGDTAIQEKPVNPAMRDLFGKIVHRLRGEIPKSQTTPRMKTNHVEP